MFLGKILLEAKERSIDINPYLASYIQGFRQCVHQESSGE